MSAINLTELFNQRIFRIPDYQRGYAWEEKQLLELWDDLDEIAEIEGEVRKHYTGTIYLEETQPQIDEKWISGSGVRFFDVVDGQQRLTTLSILLFELIRATDTGYCEEPKDYLIKTFLMRSNSSGESKIYKFSYSHNDKNHNYLLHSIFEDAKIVLQVNHRNHYTKNLDEAKDFFRNKVGTLTNNQKEILFKKITTSLQFDVRTIEKDLDVQAVFETMNNRGKPLSILEKLKNRLIFLTEKLVVEDEDKSRLRKKINEAWGKVYTCLAQNANEILDEDTFLSAHLSLYRKPAESTFSEKIAEEKVFQMFCNKSEKYDLDEGGLKEEPVSYTKIENYIIKLSVLAPIWYEIHNSDSRLLKKILMLNSSKDIKILLAAIVGSTKDDVKKNALLLNIERILFRNRVPGIGVMDERTMASWARDIYNNDEDVDSIWMISESVINSSVSTPNLIQSFRSLFTYERGPKGFHRWGNLKYFLFEYEEHLKREARETNDKVTLDDFGETTIEHIIPQHFWDNWQSEVKNVTDTLDDEDQVEEARKVLLNTLGNLTILKNGKNSSLGNRGWKEKRERFRTGSYNEIAISRYSEWNNTHISQRGKEMLKFLESKVVGLTFTEDDLRKILYYDEYISQRIDG